MTNQNLVTVTTYYMQCCVKAFSLYNFNITRPDILLTFHNNEFIFMALLCLVSMDDLTNRIKS